MTSLNDKFYYSEPDIIRLAGSNGKGGKDESAAAATCVIVTAEKYDGGDNE